jgi:hypothetical protein
MGKAQTARAHDSFAHWHVARWSGRVARTDGTSAFSIAIGALAAVAEKRKNNVHDPFGKLLAGADAVIVFLMG